MAQARQLDSTALPVPKSFYFSDREIAVVEHQGQPWFTSSALANALGYKRGDAVSRIYDRNLADFSDEISVTVKLTVTGTNISKPVRIFSLRGARKVAALAKTPRAVIFRDWLLDVREEWEAGQGKQQTAKALPAAPVKTRAKTKQETGLLGAALVKIVSGMGDITNLLREWGVLEDISRQMDEPFERLMADAQRLRIPLKDQKALPAPAKRNRLGITAPEEELFPGPEDDAIPATKRARSAPAPRP